MPKPIVWNEKCYIDYACELQLQSRLQLNLYAYGLNNIPKIFLNESYNLGYLKSPGVVVADRKIYEKIEQNIRNAFQLVETSKRYTRMMYGCLENIRTLNNATENKIENNTLKKVDVENLYRATERMMSMMVFQWLSFDLNLTIEDTRLKAYEIQMLAAPIMFQPYQIRELRAYVDVLENIHSDKSNEAIRKYIKEYAFLKNFGIDKNEDEDIERLVCKLQLEDVNRYKNILQEYEKKNAISEKQRQKLYKNIFESVSKERLQRVQNNLILMRICADEEEERHYQQARATRNLRIIMEMNQLDIYSSIDEILERIGKKESK
ncbi:MAG: hypothetical protein RSD97_08935 [Lachnospiraceae bacterium]